MTEETNGELLSINDDSYNMEYEKEEVRSENKLSENKKKNKIEVILDSPLLHEAEDADGCPTFDDSFQEKIVQALIFDPSWAKQVSEVIRKEYFTKAHLQEVASHLFDYYLKYKMIPSMNYLYSEIKQEYEKCKKDPKKYGEPDEVLFKNVQIFFKKIKTNPDSADLPGIKDQVVAFCKKQAYTEALEQAIQHLDADQYENIPRLFQKAETAAQKPELGHNYFEDQEARLTKETEKVISTGIPLLDQAFDGGWRPGKLYIGPMAPTDTGKSHFLIHTGAAAIRQGYKVAYYSFELEEKDAGRRFDSHFTRIPINELLARKAEVQEKLNIMSDKIASRLMIKYFPAYEASVNTIRAHLETLKATKGFIPDILLIDYFDLMQSIYRSGTDATHELLNSISRELDNLAKELGVVIISPSQTNRDGDDAEIITKKHVEGSYKKMGTAWAVFGLSSKGFVSILKNKSGIKSGIFKSHLDGATSTFIFERGYEDYEENGGSREQRRLNQIRKNYLSVQSAIDLNNSSDDEEDSATDDNKDNN